MLKSRSQFPPGGFVFVQPQTGWQSSPGMTFKQTVQEIIKHRRDNPRFGLNTDYATVEAELDLYTCARLRGIRGAERYIQPDDESKKALASRLSTRLANSAEAVVDTVGGVIKRASKMSAGVGTLVDWFGRGGVPVQPILAVKRAQVCSTCPKNTLSKKWTDWATGKIAERIKAQLEVRESMRLATPFDDKLGTCEACLCWLPLKTWAPLDVIREHMPASVEAELDVKCWVRTES